MYCTPLWGRWLLQTIYIIVIKNICNQENFQFTFDRTESSQALKITNKHYYRRVHKVANEENAHFWHELFLIRWNIFKESWINEWNERKRMQKDILQIIRIAPHFFNKSLSNKHPYMFVTRKKTKQNKKQCKQDISNYYEQIKRLLSSVPMTLLCRSL